MNEWMDVWMNGWIVELMNNQCIHFHYWVKLFLDLYYSH